MRSQLRIVDSRCAMMKVVRFSANVLMPPVSGARLASKRRGRLPDKAPPHRKRRSMKAAVLRRPTPPGAAQKQVRAPLRAEKPD
jgi:hypothetical protein